MHVVGEQKGLYVQLLASKEVFSMLNFTKLTI